MVTKKLIEKFRDLKTDSTFSFHPFFVNYFSNKTPTKINIEYDRKIDEQLNLLKESIVTNFYLNKYFNSIESIEKKAAEKLINVLKNDQIISDNIAKHFLLLNLSKSKLTAKQLEYFFENVDSIQIVVNFEEVFSFKDFFEKLKTNKIFLNSIENVLNKRMGQISIPEKVFNSEIVFFRSEFDGLSSFAGLREIYINLSKIEQLKNQMNTLDKRYQIIILKFYFIKLIINNLSLMSILAAKNDINYSSEFLAIQPNEEDLTQSEHLAEKLIFKVSIDWHQSVLLHELDLKYLEHFYDSLIEKGELLEFDFNKSGVVVDFDSSSLFGIEKSSFN